LRLLQRNLCSVQRKNRILCFLLKPHIFLQCWKLKRALKFCATRHKTPVERLEYFLAFGNLLHSHSILFRFSTATYNFALHNLWNILHSHWECKNYLDHTFCDLSSTSFTFAWIRIVIAHMFYSHSQRWEYFTFASSGYRYIDANVVYFTQNECSIRIVIECMFWKSTYVLFA
jgi:hypothetical protein